MAIKINYSSGKVGGNTSKENNQFLDLTNKIGENFIEFQNNNNLEKYFNNAKKGNIKQNPIELDVEWEYSKDLEAKRTEIINSIKQSLSEVFLEKDYEVEVSLTDNK